MSRAILSDGPVTDTHVSKRLDTEYRRLRAVRDQAWDAYFAASAHSNRLWHKYLAASDAVRAFDAGQRVKVVA